LVVVLVFIPVGLAAYAFMDYAVDSPRFVLRTADKVVVVGNRFVTREEVLNALGLPVVGRRHHGLNVFRVSLAAKRRQVELIPWVRSAALTRIFPDCLMVHVLERTPVAFVNMGGHVGLVDGEGVLLDKPENASFDFPVLAGLGNAANSEERRARLGVYQEFIRALENAPRSGWLISEVDLSDADDLRALLVQGRETIQVHFGHQDFLERFHNFLALMPELRKSDARIDSVDLRFRNQVVVSPEAAEPGHEARKRGSPRTIKE
jgi:cell division protein FtsQ